MSLFTQREQEIIRLMTEENLQRKEIAARLAIEPDTVRMHLYHIYGKLRDQLRVPEINRIDLVLFAILAGYVNLNALRRKYRITEVCA